MSVVRVLYRILCASFISLAIWDLVQGGDPEYELKFVKLKNYLKAGESPIDIIQAKAERFNRTLIITNVSVELAEDLCPEAMCSVTGFEKMGIEYGKSTLNIPPTRCCELMEQEYWLYPAIVDVSNLPPTCPVKKDRYDVLNFYLDSTRLPEKVPGADDWRFDVRVTCSAGDIYFVGVWITFDRSEFRKRQAEKAANGDASPDDEPPDDDAPPDGPPPPPGPGR
ncbi:uncharacterized protein [Anabrus simplex]|uniref:uncharacterized protein n=1 Tax=Anabrus simplex TaxID=316456 RepID=UPI0034DD6523